MPSNLSKKHLEFSSKKDHRQDFTPVYQQNSPGSYEMVRPSYDDKVLSSWDDFPTGSAEANVRRLLRGHTLQSTSVQTA